MADYKSFIEGMMAQKAEGKKDRYIEITDGLLAVCVKDAALAEQLEYLQALSGTLDNMDPQIYELYRSLGDRYVEVLTGVTGKLVAENGAADEAKLAVKAMISWAAEKHFAQKEWFADFLYPEGIMTEELEEALVAAPNLSEYAMKQYVKVLHVTSRSMTLEIAGAGKYETKAPWKVAINGMLMDCGNTVVRSVYHLLPGRKYDLTVFSEELKLQGKTTFSTKEESVTLNVRDFGALGDGVTDDTNCIQGAILAAPAQSRVLIPAGTYLMRSLFMKSNVNIELAKGARLLAIPERSMHAYMPAMLPSMDGKTQYNFGTWEGNPLECFSGVLTGFGVENVTVYGEGVLDGGASRENWWMNPKVKNIAYRPRLFFIKDCKHVSLQGITCQNSPSWTLHPYFSDDLGFYNVNVKNPSDSPNTDGLDPESCRNVEIAGVKFSLGDDCIAVKAGKIYMGKTYKQSSEAIRIHNCLMENGHGAVTLGSEMAGGVKNLTVEDCVFSHTDRGLRIKTRRGRGKDAVLDRIIFRNIEMEHVMTPFVVNSFYFCDPDGKTDYVQSRELYPLDERTPLIRRLEFEDIDAKNCHVAAAYFEGLPEQKIDELIMRHVEVSYTDQPKCDVPAMSNGVEPCTKKGVVAKNVHRLILDHVNVSGQDGEAFAYDGIDELSIIE